MQKQRAFDRSLEKSILHEWKFKQYFESRRVHQLIYVTKRVDEWP